MVAQFTGFECNFFYPSSSDLTRFYNNFIYQPNISLSIYIDIYRKFFLSLLLFPLVCLKSVMHYLCITETKFIQFYLIVN